MKRLGKFEPELAIGVGMDEIITLVIDDIASTAFGGGRADPGKCWPHIDVDDHDAKRPPVRRVHRRRDAQHRDTRRFDVEIDRRDIDPTGR